MWSPIAGVSSCPYFQNFVSLLWVHGDIRVVTLGDHEFLTFANSISHLKGLIRAFGRQLLFSEGTSVNPGQHGPGEREIGIQFDCALIERNGIKGVTLA